MTAAESPSIVVNGKTMPLPAPVTVAELLERLGLRDRPVAVERNRELVPKAQFSEVSVEVGDELEIVTFFGGG